MSVKSQMCNIVKDTKEELGMTYDQILEVCDGSLHRSQLSNILNYNGMNVSVDTIEYLLSRLGVTLEIQTRTDLGSLSKGML